LDFKPYAELSQLVGNISGKRSTIVHEEEVPLLEANATVEDVTEDDTTCLTDSDKKKQELLDELNKLV
jgi:hypothetical protein